MDLMSWVQQWYELHLALWADLEAESAVFGTLCTVKTHHLESILCLRDLLICTMPGLCKGMGEY